MTHIEKMRLQAAIQALSGKRPSIFPNTCITHGSAELQFLRVLRQRKPRGQNEELVGVWRSKSVTVQNVLITGTLVLLGTEAVLARMLNLSWRAERVRV